jgi:hypothetical protein
MTNLIFMMVIWLWTPSHGMDEGRIFAPSCEAAQATAEQWARNAGAELQIVSCERAP